MTAAKKTRPLNAPLADPTYLTKQEIADKIIAWVKRIEAEKTDIDIVRIGNGHRPDDVMPGEQGEPTYADRRREKSEQQANIIGGFPKDIQDLVVAFFKETS